LPSEQNVYVPVVLYCCNWCSKSICVYERIFYL